MRFRNPCPGNCRDESIRRMSTGGPAPRCSALFACQLVHRRGRALRRSFCRPGCCIWSRALSRPLSCGKDRPLCKCPGVMLAQRCLASESHALRHFVFRLAPQPVASVVEPCSLATKPVIGLVEERFGPGHRTVPSSYTSTCCQWKLLFQENRAKGCVRVPISPLLPTWPVRPGHSDTGGQLKS